MNVTVKPKKIFDTLLIIIGILTALNLLGILFSQLTDYPKINKYIVRLTDFDKEANIPTLYSTMTLFLAALLLGYIAAVSKRSGKLWLGLCLLFAFLGIDEFASFHELLSGPVRTLLDLDGFLYLAWVVPYALLAVTLFLLYIKFMLKLSHPVRVMFLLAGIIYLAGAIGCEVLGGKYYEEENTANFSYAIIYTAEELLEMLGITIFIYSLLFHIQTELYKEHLRVQFEQLPATSEKQKDAQVYTARGKVEDL